MAYGEENHASEGIPKGQAGEENGNQQASPTDHRSRYCTPLSTGMLIRLRRDLGLLSPTASERYDLVTGGDETYKNSFPTDWYYAASFALGFRPYGRKDCCR